MTDFLSIPQHQLRVSGNTAGATASLSSGTVTLAGGNNITLSQAGNAVTISGAAAAGAQTAISGIAASNTTYTSGTVTFTGVGGGVTVSSNTGQRVDISVAAQSVQPETQTFVGGIGNSQTTYTSGTVNLSVVAGNLTIRSTTGQAFQFSASQTVQAETQTFVGGIAASNTTYTSGTVTITGVGGGITVSSNTGQRVDLSVAAQSVQTQGNLSLGVSTGGNTVGNTTVNTGSRFVLVASGNATASQATAAGASTVTISVGTQTVQTQDVLSVGASNVGNTSGDTTVNTGSRLVFAGGNNITISQGTAAGATTLTISGPNVGGAQTGISGLANSQTTYTSGSVTFSELGAITIRSTTGQQFQFSVNSQTVQTQDVLSVGVSTGGNTAGNTTVNTGSRFVIVGTNGITASQGTAAGATTVTLSGITQSVQPETQTFVGGIAASNTTYTSGTVSFTGVGGGITVSSNTGQRVDLSVAAQSVQTQGIGSIGVSTGGNTAGNTTVNTGTRFVLVGSNMISLSQATAAGASTVTINATQSVQTQSLIQALYDGANSITTGTVRLTNANGVSFSINGQTLSGSVNDSISMFAVSNTTQSTTGAVHKSVMSFAGAGIASVGITGNSVLISVPAGGGAGDGGVFAGASTMGNTAGSTGTVSTGNFVLVGTGPISLSQSTGAAGSAATISINAPATSSLSGTGNIQISTNGSTISIGDGGEILDFWDNLVPGASTTFQLSDAALNIYPLNPANANFPGFMSVSSIFFDVSGTVSTAASFTRSMSLGFYTRVNSTQLSLASSASTSWGTNAANANVNNSMGGRRWVTFQSSQFAAGPSFHAGSDYYLAVWARSSSGSQTFNYLGQLLPYATGVRSGFMSAASATNTTLAHYPFLGNYSVSFSTAMPSALAASDVNASNATAISLPRIIFNNVGSNIV